MIYDNIKIKLQGLILSLKNTFLEQPGGKCQTEPPSLDQRQAGLIKSVLLVIIGWLVGWYRSFLRNGSKEFSNFLHEVMGL